MGATYPKGMGYERTGAVVVVRRGRAGTRERNRSNGRRRFEWMRQVDKAARRRRVRVYACVCSLWQTAYGWERRGAGLP